MKRTLFLLLVVAMHCASANCQNETKKFEPSGKVNGQIFLNYHYDFTEGVQKTSQFEVLRSNLGYTYNFSEKFTGRITMDAANDGKAYSSFLKVASLEWKQGMFTVEGGMMKTFIYDTQEDEWGNRYVMESFQDREKFYSTFDLGVKAAFRPSDIVQLRAGIFNGEGYKKLQDDFGVQRKSFDIILHPIKEITFKAYYDFMPKKDTAIHNSDLLFTQRTANFFAGYNKPGKFRIGAEYNIQNGNGNRKDHSLYGVSVYGTLTVKVVELFARYDQLSSNKINLATESWNVSHDYSLVSGGVQMSPAKGVRMSLNYRHYIPESNLIVNSDMVYVSLELKF